MYARLRTLNHSPRIGEFRRSTRHQTGFIFFLIACECSFYQLIHQGRVIPCDFIGFCESQEPIQLSKLNARVLHTMCLPVVKEPVVKELCR